VRVNIDIGGTSTSGTGEMKIDRTELRLLTSTKLTFNAVTASVDVFEADIPDTRNVADRVTNLRG